MFRWYVSGSIMEYIQTIHIVCATKEEALAAWVAAFPNSGLTAWSVFAKNIDETTGELRRLHDERWTHLGPNHVYESGGYDYHGLRAK